MSNTQAYCLQIAAQAFTIGLGMHIAPLTKGIILQDPGTSLSPMKYFGPKEELNALLELIQEATADSQRPVLPEHVSLDMQKRPFFAFKGGEWYQFDANMNIIKDAQAA